MDNLWIRYEAFHIYIIYNAKWVVCMSFPWNTNSHGLAKRYINDDYELSIFWFGKFVHWRVSVLYGWCCLSIYIVALHELQMWPVTGSYIHCRILSWFGMTSYSFGNRCSLNKGAFIWKHYSFIMHIQTVINILLINACFCSVYRFLLYMFLITYWRLNQN